MLQLMNSFLEFSLNGCVCLYIPFNLILLSVIILPVDLKPHNFSLCGWTDECILPLHHQPCVIFVHYTQTLPLEFIEVLKFTVWKRLHRKE